MANDDIPGWATDPADRRRVDVAVDNLVLVSGADRDFVERAVVSAMCPDEFPFDYDSRGATVEEAAAVFRARMPVRMARCNRYGLKTRRTGRASSHCECGVCAQAIDRDINLGVCQCERPSSSRLAFFQTRPDREFDEFYCGCAGWD